MKLIEPNVKEVVQELELEGIYKQIAYGGHLCYKSEKVGNENEFVDRLIKSGHLSPLEHGTVYLEINGYDPCITKFEDNPFSKVTYDPVSGFFYITTNLRVIIENDWAKESFKKFKCEKPDITNLAKRRSFHITCSRGIMDEFVRHRVFSFSCESTRYCNYSKDRFGNELTFIKPYWYDNADAIKKQIFVDHCSITESDYLELLQNNCKPQDAREVLPLSIKSEFLMTGFEEDWKQFFKLRCDTAAHPDAQIVANKIKELL